MTKISSTYRFLALLTALSFLAGIILPSGLNAHGLICGMEMETEMAESAVEHCDMMVNHPDEPSPHHPEETDSDDCNMDIACACSINDSPVIPEAIPVTAKTQITLPVTNFSFTTEWGSSNPFAEAENPSLYSSSPPIYILVNSFLN